MITNKGDIIMKNLIILFSMLILFVSFTSCDKSITEPIELTLTEKYTKVLSRDGFWMWDSVYAEEYIQIGDSLCLGFNKALHLYYYEDGTFQVLFIHKSIDNQILIRKSFSEIYRWSIEENGKVNIKYVLDSIETFIPIVSLDKHELKLEHRTYEYKNFCNKYWK